MSDLFFPSHPRSPCIPMNGHCSVCMPMQYYPMPSSHQPIIMNAYTSVPSSTVMFPQSHCQRPAHVPCSVASRLETLTKEIVEITNMVQQLSASRESKSMLGTQENRTKLTSAHSPLTAVPEVSPSSVRNHVPLSAMGNEIDPKSLARTPETKKGRRR